MSKVGFSGYYGMSNYGDDLFALVSMLGARRYWPDHFPRLIGPRAIGVPGEYGFLGWLPIETYQGAGLLGKAARLSTLLSNSLLVDRFIFAGGSLFHSNSSAINELVAKTAWIRPTRISAIGVSIGPFVTAAEEKRTRSYLNTFEYLSVRDRASFDIASSFDLECPVEYGGDLAGIYPVLREGGPSALGRSDTLIGFSPCCLPENPESAKSYCDLFVDQIRRARKEHEYTACIIDLNHHGVMGDGPLCAYTAMRLQESGVPYVVCTYREMGVSGTWELISSLAAYITVRLHGAITAYATDTPFFLIQYHRKCSDFLEEIEHPFAQSSVMHDAKIACVDGLVTRLRAGDATPRLPAQAYASRSAENFTAAPWC